MPTRETAEFYEVRTALQALAGRLFVGNASDRQRQALALRSAFGRLEKSAAGRRGDVAEPQREFFRVLLEGAGNQTLRTIVEGLQARSSVLRSQSMSVPGRAREIVGALRAIVDAVTAGDADAAADACRRYSEQSARSGLAQIGEVERTATHLIIALVAGGMVRGWRPPAFPAHRGHEETPTSFTPPIGGHQRRPQVCPIR